MNEKKHERNVICANCGVKGHYVKTCKDPITSFGIIAFKIYDDNDVLNDKLKGILKPMKIKETKSNIRFLMIQRKDTMGYIDLLRGKYDNKSDVIKIKNIKIYLNEMTYIEKQSLLTKTFDTQWGEIWLNHKSRCFLNEYELAKKKYESLDIETLVSQSDHSFDTTEFSFAKGRRNMREQNIACAQREFLEETGYDHTSYDFIKNYPAIIEEFTGTNGIKYRHVYYLVKMKDKIKQPTVDLNNILQCGEVLNLGWFTLNQCLALIRPYDTAKKAVLQNVYNDIIKMNNNFNCSDIFKLPQQNLQSHVLYNSIEKQYMSHDNYLIEGNFK